jgi:hypothetical protein
MLPIGISNNFLFSPNSILSIVSITFFSVECKVMFDFLGNIQLLKFQQMVPR